MDVAPTTLDGRFVSLEPLSLDHRQALIQAASDGEQWKSTVTIVPRPEEMTDYIEAALKAQGQGHELAFIIRRKAGNEIVGTTRYYFIDRENRHLEIGYTWLAASAQRTEVNTESKLLLLTHAFESWGCIRVAFVTDVLNQTSRGALVRLGAKEEGVLRNHLIMPGGRYRDSVSFSIIESEWPEIKGRLAAKLL
jgi:N-acetyltransferase